MCFTLSPATDESIVVALLQLHPYGGMARAAQALMNASESGAHIAVFPAGHFSGSCAQVCAVRTGARVTGSPG